MIDNDFTDKLIQWAEGDKELLNKFYRAVLSAAQYDAFSHEGEKFRLLEGTVKRTPSGKYQFFPSEQFKSMLETNKVPRALRIEEGRLLELIKLALAQKGGS